MLMQARILERGDGVASCYVIARTLRENKVSTIVHTRRTHVFSQEEPLLSFVSGHGHVRN